ncbi:MAG TPA: radical SAM protein [Vicinamibacterales bacterium]|nr:radical SAM protein [Vicinamibacterales bacterium]
MRVCLATVHHNPSFTPLALLYLKAYLVEHDGVAADAITVLEFTPDDKTETIADRILATQPDIVGLSCYVWNIRTLTAAATLIKDRDASIQIVVGGPEVGPVAKDVFARTRAFDVIVTSEGEIPLSRLVAARREHAPLETVDGIVFRRGDEIVATADAAIVQDLNQLPSPHRPGYMDGHTSTRIVCLETQRGCVFRCNFCFYNKDFSIRNRRFDLDRVKHEIAYWLERDVEWIYLMDPIFNLNAERAKEICRFVIEHNHRRIKFHSEVWAEFFDDELARLMKEANFQFLEVGLQSTDDTALATVERRLKMQKFVDGIEHLKRYQVPFEIQLIYGLPGDTIATFKKSLNFAASLNTKWLAVFPLQVLPGTELWHKAGTLQIDFEREPPYALRSHYSMTEADMAYGHRVIKALQLLGDSRTLRFLAKERGITFAEIVDEWMEWCEQQQAFAPPDPNPKQFVAEYCDRNGIPPAFFQHFASWEFSG